MPGDIDKIFGTDQYLKEQYTDADIGAKITDAPMQDYLFPLVNNQPIGIQIKPPAKGSSVALAIIKRGARWFGWKQSLTLKVEMDYTVYLDKYMAFEELFVGFLEYDLKYADVLQENNSLKYLYISRFNNQYLDTLPEMMYWNHHLFTNNPNRWSRFKRLFTAIQLNVDPVLIDTLKFKLVRYLMGERSILTMNDTKDLGHLKRVPDPQILHKAMDLLIFMPYCYLFMVFKAMDIHKQLMLMTTDPFDPALIEDKTN